MNSEHLLKYAGMTLVLLGTLKINLNCDKFLIEVDFLMSAIKQLVFIYFSIAKL